MNNPTTVPTVSTTSITADAWAVVITRSGGRVVTVEVGSRITAEAMAAEVRGALADAFHAGYGEGRKWEAE